MGDKSFAFLGLLLLIKIDFIFLGLILIDETFNLTPNEFLRGCTCFDVCKILGDMRVELPVRRCAINYGFAYELSLCSFRAS